MTDAVPVAFEVVKLDQITRGPIMAVACVRVDIEGVEVLLQGITMRRKGTGKAKVTPPQFRDPRTGTWCHATVLPDELWSAIALEVAERITGQSVETLPDQ